MAKSIKKRESKKNHRNSSNQLKNVKRIVKNIEILKNATSNN